MIVRPSFPAVFLTLILAAWSSPALFAQEVQQHGVLFEEWIRNQFFGGYQPPSYTGKWDIPAEANSDHGGIPVNPKATRYGTPIGLGDALRQFDIDEPYLLIVGFWDQEGPHKRFVNVVAARVDPETQRRLWHPIQKSDLEALDTMVKDRSIPVEEVRRRALAIKNAPPFSEAIMQVNPKIDTKGQRRLQCSLRFRDFFDHVAPDASSERSEKPELFGVPVPKVRDSGPRTFSPVETD